MTGTRKLPVVHGIVSNCGRYSTVILLGFFFPQLTRLLFEKMAEYKQRLRRLNDVT